MNIDINKLPVLAKEYLAKVLQHAKFIFIIMVVGLSSFLIFEINQLTSQEPEPEQVTEQLEIIKRPKIDQETIDKIRNLEDRNIAVQALFKKARDNPFQD